MYIKRERQTERERERKRERREKRERERERCTIAWALSTLSVDVSDLLVKATGKHFGFEDGGLPSPRSYMPAAIA